MKKIFDKGVLHIISDCSGCFLITSDIDSKVYFLSDDKEITQIETYSKASYVYRYDADGIFIPSMYYRAVGYDKDLIRKYRIRTDLLERHGMAACDNKNIYYYNMPVSTNAKLWRLNFESGLNEEIKLDIPKRKNRKIRYSYVSINENELLVIYYYFGEQESCFDDMFMRIYSITDDNYELLCERLIEKGVRGVYEQRSESTKGKVLLFDKVVCENAGIKVKGEYLALLNSENEINRIFNIPYDIGNGVVSYAVSFEKRLVVLMWRHRVLTCDLDTEEIICDLTDLLSNNKKESFLCIRFEKDKLLVGSDTGLFELEENEYLGKR